MLATVPTASPAAMDCAPSRISQEVAQRMRTRRKELHLSQLSLAQKSGVSLGSLKRFEQDSLISFDSLIRLAIALDCQQDFAALFCGEELSPADEGALTASAQTQICEEESLEDIIAQGHVLLDRIAFLEHAREEARA